MKKQINYYSSIVLLIITFCCILYAQEQTVQGTELKEEEPVSYKISEIPSKLEETQTYISKLNTDIISPEKVSEREKELEIVNESYKILRAQTDSIDLEKEYSTTLKEYQQKWVTQKNKVSDWASLVKSRTEELEETKKQLLANNKIWERTDKLAREEGAPSELINSIRDLINSINR